MINNFKTMGEIRKEADRLLDELGAAYLGNIAWDNRWNIKIALDNIKNSKIDWTKDVVKSVRNEVTRLTSMEVIKPHMDRDLKNGFHKDNPICHNTPPIKNDWSKYKF